MKSSSHLVVTVVAFLLGCGLVAILENDSAEMADLARRNESAEAENERIAGELRQVRQDNRDLAARLDAEVELAGLRNRAGELEQLNAEIRRERDSYQNSAEDLRRRLQTSEQELASRERELADAMTRIASVRQEKDEGVAALQKSRNTARMLEA